MDRFTIAEEPADSADVRWCFEQYYKELGTEFGYEVDTALPLGVAQLTRPDGLVLVVREDGMPVGCGAVKLLDDGIGEIKRMWVSPTVRGRGLGGRLLDALEAEAAAAGKSVTRLETNDRLESALAMYRRRGYVEVAPFNEEPFATHWFRKALPEAKDGGYA
jgi:ribosomal protein S18 acetylase RimI-like enzyme